MSAQKKTRRRFKRTRRGSVIILAVAVIAVLAVFAAAYVTVIRLERNSVAAYSDNVSFQQQVTAAVSEIRAILTADLFGNKIVNSTTPRRADPSDPTSPSVWPLAFEDGEFFDYPQVAMNDDSPSRDLTFDDRTREDRESNPNPPTSALLELNPASGPSIAYPDDAWLAASEPVRQQDRVGDFGSYLQNTWDTWPQITNLRSAYRLRDTDNDGDFDAWVRDDGLFADPGQFFVQEENNRGNPAADLSAHWNDPGLPTSERNGPWLGVDQDIYNFQKGELADPSDPEIRFERDDERFWVDVDHDGFPDARWQELDVFGSLFGLRWVIATRIIDNSAMANINAHMSGTPVENPSDGGAADKHFATGLTPADVDFNRLLRVFASDTWDRRHPDLRFSSVQPSNLAQAFEKHVRGLGAQEAAGFRLEEGLDQLLDLSLESQTTDSNRPNPYLDLLTVPQPDTPTPSIQDDYVNSSQNYLPFQGPDRLQREIFYRHAAAAPDRRLLTRLSFIPQSDEIDLRAYWGFNYERVLSRIEQRFDRYGNFDFLPSSDEPDDEIGIMRSRQPGEFGSIARDPSPGVSPPMTTDNRIERIQKDFRRHLTTISGEGRASPVPNFSSSSALTRKVPVNDFPSIRTPFNAETVSPKKRRDDLIRRSYEAALWALAPLAVETGERRLFRGVPDGFITQDFHYGGGSDGDSPAERILMAVGQPVGASYALLRAASWAVNLADAVDEDESLQSRPTIARLFPTPNGATGTTLQNAPTVLTTKLPFGELPENDDAPDLLRPEYVGLPENGVTIVGLDRQPFLRAAYSLAVYQHDRIGQGFENMPELDGSEDANQVGSLIAVQIGNPWPEAISVEQYRAIITDGTNIIELELSQAMGSPTIAPGDRLTLYLPLEQDGLPDEALDWQSAVDQFIDPGNVGPTLELDPDAITSESENVGDPILWDFDTSSPASVLLVRDVESPGNSVSNPTASPTPVLVDRMTSDAAVSFPARITGTRSFSFLTSPDIEEGTFRIAIAATLRRPSASPPLGGFPAYIIERPNDNIAFSAETDPAIQAWLDSDAVPPASDLVDELSTASALDFDDPPLPSMPSMQLFVPDGPLQYQSELMQVSAFSTTFVHASNAAPEVEPGRDFQPPLNPGAGQGAWTTFSEHLGADWNFFYNAANASNPYLGLLDPSRFIMGSDLTAPSGVTPLPATLQVPLATRLLDAFETLDPPGELIRGRININTAPRAVLELLPQIDFRDWRTRNVIAMDGFTTQTTQPFNDRIKMIEEYRTRTRAERGGVATPPVRSPVELTNLDGLRSPVNLPATEPKEDPLDIKGFVNLGELSILGRWAVNAENGEIADTANRSFAGFMELGVEGTNNQTGATPEQYPLDPRAGAFVGPTGDTNRLIPRQDVVPEFDGTDDVEERLALFRAVSNIASTRSDVFTAWFMIRGYDPAAIEAIEVNGTSDEDINGYLNQLVPTFEERWLAVFDRSNVRTPTDRPRVLLLVKLPLDIPLDTQEDEGG